MSWLLDTCVVSEATRKAPCPQVVTWLSQQQETALFLSVLTLGELEKGIAKLPVGTKRRRIERWLRHDLCQRFGGRILPVDEPVAIEWGRMQGEAERKGRPLPSLDALIAATAIVHQLTVVTRDTADMRDTGARLFDPWTL